MWQTFFDVREIRKRSKKRACIPRIRAIHSHFGGMNRKREVSKSTRGMPRVSEAMKDAISCDKLGGGAHTRYIPRFPNGATPLVEDQ